MNRKTALAAASLATALMLGTGLSHAQKIDDDVANFDKAGITLNQAITAAEEHHAGSKAIQAEFEHERGEIYYEVEVVTNDKQVYEVRVNATDGKIISSRPDND